VSGAAISGKGLPNFRQTRMDVVGRNGIVLPENNSKFACRIKRMLRRENSQAGPVAGDFLNRYSSV